MSMLNESPEYTCVKISYFSEWADFQTRGTEARAWWWWGNDRIWEMFLRLKVQLFFLMGWALVDFRLVPPVFAMLRGLGGRPYDSTQSFGFVITLKAPEEESSRFCVRKLDERLVSNVNLSLVPYGWSLSCKVQRRKGKEIRLKECSFLRVERGQYICSDGRGEMKTKRIIIHICIYIEIFAICMYI